MDTIAAAGLGVALILILLVLRWKVRTSLKAKPTSEPEPEVQSMSGCRSGQLVHRLCPHNNVVQSFDVEEKDSLDDHLDILARKLAEKESRLRLSKSKIRETQNEIQNLHAIDHNVRLRYREVMDSLRTDLMSNEKECRKLQEQIEWVSRRRAELKEEASVAAIGFENLRRIPEYGALITGHGQEERTVRQISHSAPKCEFGDRMVRRGHRLYGEAAAELASNLAELQKGRTPDRVTEKSIPPSTPYQRPKKEPSLPNAAPMAPLVIKSSPPPELVQMGRSSQLGYQMPM